MTTLYLVRHGETIDNAAQILQGQLPGKLNATGVAQAEQMAFELKDTSFDAILSSDLCRAMDTARIVARPRGMTIETTALLRERDWGDFTGHFIPDLAGLPFPKNTETLPQLMARATRFIDWVKSKYDGKTVLAVGHGIINKAILSVYSGAPMHEILKMTNAEYRVLKLE